MRPGNRSFARDDNAPRFLLRSATELEESCLTHCDNLIPIQSACDMDEEEEDFRGETGNCVPWTICFLNISALWNVSFSFFVVELLLSFFEFNFFFLNFNE